MRPGWITPDWPAPATVRACVTTRGAVGPMPYGGFNLALHVGDEPERVLRNRAELLAATGVEPLWLDQVHGVDVVDAGKVHVTAPRADAAVCRVPGRACLVMTADCLPLLLCDRAGTVVAAAHAGWRGLAAGVIERTVACMGVPPSEILAWLGPAIGPGAFEVGAEVVEAFSAQDANALCAFRPGVAQGKWLADLFLLARQRLARLGVESVGGEEVCTYSNTDRFYSYRRDGTTGRFASLVWLTDPQGVRSRGGAPECHNL